VLREMVCVMNNYVLSSQTSRSHKPSHLAAKWQGQGRGGLAGGLCVMTTTMLLS